MGRLWSLGFLTAALLDCSGGGGDGGRSYACRYQESTSFICTGYSDYSDDAYCVDVTSPERCEEITESYNDCTGDCCSDTTYYDVSVTPGSCDDPTTGSGGSAGSGGTTESGGATTSSGGSGAQSSSGGTATGSGGSTSSACIVRAEDSPCGFCLKTSCCEESEACASSSCPELTSCIVDCADEACFDDCEALYPDGITPLNDLYDCSTIWCSTECG